MPQEIKTFAFEGHALTFRQDNGEWWATAEEAAPLLGYARSQSVVNIFNRHKSEFRPGESGQLDLSYPDGGTQRTRVFSPRGLARLCLLGRTEVSRRLHDWVIYDVMEALRTGARVVTEEQMREAIRVAVDAVVQQYAGQIGHLSSSLSAVARVAEVQASNAGRLLSLMSRDPEVRRVLEEERDRRSGQTKIPFPDGPVLPGPGSDTRTEEAAS